MSDSFMQDIAENPSHNADCGNCQDVILRDSALIIGGCIRGGSFARHRMCENLAEIRRKEL